jgi:hypothetical protein
MKTLMDKYMHALSDERDAFWDYVELIECEMAKEHKALFVAIAQDELQHFHKIVSAVWTDMSNKTEMEKAFYHSLMKEYEMMKEYLEHHK